MLLDTTLLIDFERSDGWLDAAIEEDDDLAISAVTLAELLVGVDLARGRYRATRRALLEALLAAVPVLPYDDSTAAAHAALMAEVRRQGRPRGAHDLLIAATAVATRRVVLSADASAFDGLPGVSVRLHR